MTSLGRFYQDIFEQHHDEAWDRAPGKDVFIRALQRLRTTERGKLVDIGCGTGFLLDRIQREVSAQWDLSGIDFAPAAIARGTERYPSLKLSCQDGTATTFAPETFNVLVSYGAMEHFPDPEAAIREVARLLVPGGQFLIMLPTLGAYRTDRTDEAWYEDLTGQPQWNLGRSTWESFFVKADLSLRDATDATRYGAKQPDVYFLGEKPARTH